MPQRFAGRHTSTCKPSTAPPDQSQPIAYWRNLVASERFGGCPAIPPSQARIRVDTGRGRASSASDFCDGAAAQLDDDCRVLGLARLGLRVDRSRCLRSTVRLAGRQLDQGQVATILKGSSNSLLDLPTLPMAVPVMVKVWFVRLKVASMPEDLEPVT